MFKSIIFLNFRHKNDLFCARGQRNASWRLIFQIDKLCINTGSVQNTVSVINSMCYWLGLRSKSNWLVMANFEALEDDPDPNVFIVAYNTKTACLNYLRTAYPGCGDQMEIIYDKVLFHAENGYQIFDLNTANLISVIKGDWYLMSPSLRFTSSTSFFAFNWRTRQVNTFVLCPNSGLQPINVPQYKAKLVDAKFIKAKTYKTGIVHGLSVALALKSQNNKDFETALKIAENNVVTFSNQNTFSNFIFVTPTLAVLKFRRKCVRVLDFSPDL